MSDRSPALGPTRRTWSTCPIAEDRRIGSDRRRSSFYSVPTASTTENRTGSGHSCQRCASPSSRIRPANDRETSGNDGNGRSIESAGQAPDSGIAAGSEIDPENTLKVETRVRTPLGLQAKAQVRLPVQSERGAFMMAMDQQGGSDRVTGRSSNPVRLRGVLRDRARTAVPGALLLVTHDSPEAEDLMQVPRTHLGKSPKLAHGGGHSIGHMGWLRR
jgi:hypothetical protein